MVDRILLNFLCVGFQKCGTSSLFEALRKNEKIYLPKQKETFFCRNINHETEELISGAYPKELTDGRIVGGIEPTYYSCAKAVYDYYGDEIRLIICMNDPVKALFSSFKMHMRDGSEDSLEYYEKYGEDFVNMFEAWIPDHCEQYHYEKWISRYLNYYDRDNICFVISNELYDNPSSEMGRVQSHIGLKKEDQIDYRSFPRINEGKGVSRNLEFAMINRSIFRLWLEEESVKKRVRLDLARQDVFEITTIDIRQKDFESVFSKCRNLFAQDIGYIERIIGKNLRGEWY